LEVSGTSLMTQEDLLSGSNQKEDFESSYLITEMDSARPDSPSKSLNTSGGFGRKRKALKSDSLKLKEQAIRQSEGDSTTDFIEYLEIFVDCYKQLDHLDSAGTKLMNVFSQDKRHQVLSLRNWILNLDVWGSYLPLNA